MLSLCYVTLNKKIKVLHISQPPSIVKYLSGIYVTYFTVWVSHLLFHIFSLTEGTVYRHHRLINTVLLHCVNTYLKCCIFLSHLLHWLQGGWFQCNIIFVGGTVRCDKMWHRGEGVPKYPKKVWHNFWVVPVRFCSLAVLDPWVGDTMDVLSPFIPVLCHSDCLFHGELMLENTSLVLVWLPSGTNCRPRFLMWSQSLRSLVRFKSLFVIGL